MDTFKSRMALAGVSDPVKCRAFPITLKKVFLKWFNSLPPRSINRFSDLVLIFLAHFTTKRFKPKPSSSLLNWHQCQNESLWDFLERYNAETLLVSKVQTQAAILTLLNGLQPRQFKTSLSKIPPESPEEIQTRAEKYIFLEETEKVTANPGRHQSDKKVVKTNTQGRTCIQGPVNTMSIPLNVSLSELFREAGQVERFPKPKVLKMRANTNKSLFCEYHNGFGHRTEDCNDF